MSTREPSAPAPPSPFVIDQEPPPTPNFLGNAPTVDPPPGKKTTSRRKNKAPKKRVAGETKPIESVDVPPPQRVRHRYKPYQKADPTPEPEGNIPADQKELERLDAAVKALYKSDREVLEYIKSLKRRTAAMLEQVNRTDPQLRSYKDGMKHTQHIIGQWEKARSLLANPQLFGDNDPNPDLFPTLTRNENGIYPTIEEHFSKNVDHPDFPHDYARGTPGESSHQPPNNDDEEEHFSRPQTPLARQPSLPPGHEDENGLEYVEDEIDTRSDLSVPPYDVALTSRVSILTRSGAGPEVVSDSGVLPPPSNEELARISEVPKSETTDPAAGLAMPQPTDPPLLGHPLVQPHTPPSPDPVPRPGPQLVVPHPVPSTISGGKRKRLPTPEEEVENDLASSSAPVVHPSVDGSPQIEARSSDDRVYSRSNEDSVYSGSSEDRTSSKRRRFIAPQPFLWDFQMFVAARRRIPTPTPVDPPTRENSLEFSPQRARREASPPSVAASQVQKEDSEIERSQVVEMLSHGVEQGESEDEGQLPTGNILGDLGGPQRSVPALTADNTQTTSTNATRSGVETPAEPQVSAEVQASVPEDIFGPTVPSTKVNKISDRLPTEVFTEDTDGDVVISDSEHGVTNVPSKSTRLSPSDGRADKEGYKVFRKTPIRPRISSRATDAENALAVEVEAESRDMLEPLPSPKKKRAAGTRTRKPKSTPSIEAGPDINPEIGLPSISTRKPPSKLRRGRSASVQPEIPAVPKTPVRRPTRGRK